MRTAILLFGLLGLCGFIFLVSIIAGGIGIYRKKRPLWIPSLFVGLLGFIGVIFFSVSIARRAVSRVSAVGQEIMAETADESGCDGMFSIFDDAAERFESVTCLELPADAILKSSFDSYMLGEGDYIAIFETTGPIPTEWLAQQAPWASEWQQGPLPESMRRQGLDIFQEGNSAVFNGDTIWFAAIDLSSGSFEYQRGNLLILSPDTNEIIFTFWDH